MKPLMLLRPEPGWSISADTARAMGLEVIGGPLFTIEPVAWEAPDSGDYDGLLIGSANVFRHGGDQLRRYVKLPTHVVGETTAETARQAGFLTGRVGRGGLQSVLDALEGRKLRLLRLAGEGRVPLCVPDGIGVDTRVVYRAEPAAIEDADRLQDPCVVALHSGTAAERFAQECERLSVDRSLLDLVAIGPRVAELVGEGWHAIHIAEQADDARLLALAKDVCQVSDQ